MLTRILLLACMATGLSSCGTATHLLGQATGVLSSVTAPVTGILRLSDSPESAAAPDSKKPETPAPARHDRQRTEAQRGR